MSSGWLWFLVAVALILWICLGRWGHEFLLRSDEINLTTRIFKDSLVTEDPRAMQGCILFGPITYFLGWLVLSAALKDLEKTQTLRHPNARR